MSHFSRTDIIFFAIMTAAAFAAVIVTRLAPEITAGVLEGYVWPFLAAFVFDIATRGRMTDGLMEPLTMNMRVAGVLFGTFLFMVLDVVTRTPVA